MNVRVIGVPVFEGCDIRGIDKAPAAIRRSGALEVLKERFEVVDCGDIELLPSNKEAIFEAKKDIKYADIVLDMAQKLSSVVKKSIEEGAFTITFGGDHSLGVGTVSGASLAKGGNIGVVWFDAHSDINTSITSPSKNYHGMPFASALYVGDEEFRAIGEDKPKVMPENGFLLGVRSMDKGEIELRDRLGIDHYTIALIHEKGMKQIATEMVQKLKANGVDNLHVSFDLDVISPEITTAYNCPEPNGVNISEMVEFFETIFASGLVCSLDITEYNPDKDGDGKGIEIIKEILATLVKSL